MIGFALQTGPILAEYARKNMSLTRRELMIRISEETGLVQSQVSEIIERSFGHITEILAKGDRVELREFGVFEVVIRKPRTGRNPNQPEKDVPIPARAVVKFKAGKSMKSAVDKLTPKKRK